ncbi:MAG: tyrosine-type recombinase/integrase [Patescibacteria group bacterium]|nr:tyrosine-type recombinase/integrase [Patescibacteria group bacterium]
MSTTKRKNTWYVDFRFDRKRYRKRSPLNTKAGAELYESTLRQTLARGESIEIEEKQKEKIPTLSEFYPTWMNSYVKSNNKPSTQESKKSIFNYNILPCFSKKKLDEITTKDIEDYKAMKIKFGLKNKTINNHISCLGTCLKTAVDWDIMEYMPKIKLLKIPAPLTVYLTEEECVKLLETADGIYHDMIQVALCTGVRLGELVALKWSDVDFSSKTLNVQRSITVGIEGTPKSNKGRKIPIIKPLVELLSKLNSQKNSEYIFTRKDGIPMSQSQSEKVLKKIVQQANITKISWHGLRHTVASQMANTRGVNIQEVQKFLGHADLKTTMRYVHTSQDSLVSAMDVFHKNSKIWTQGGHKDDYSFSKIHELAVSITQ